MGIVEQRALQAAVVVGSLVPIGAGAAGILFGPRLVALSVPGFADLDSHFRYLSGLLLAIGVGFLSTAPRIERCGTRFRLLACVVVLGGLGRLASLLSIGAPSRTMVAALAMELVVVPCLVLWQSRVAKLERGGYPNRLIEHLAANGR